MNIFPVRINEWFPEDDKMFDTVMLILPYLRCEVCGKRVPYEKGFMMHSAPWGGPSEAWCSEKCLRS